MWINIAIPLYLILAPEQYISPGREGAMCGFINIRYKNVLNSRAHKNADGGDRSTGAAIGKKESLILTSFHTQK